MAMTLEQLVEAMSRMTENVNKHVEAQSGAHRRNGSWDDLTKFKNITLFGGDSKEWEEFQFKVKGQVGAGDPGVVAIMEEIELVMESTVEEADWSMVGDETQTEEVIEEMSRKVRNILLSFTTKEANAIVRRCRGNGLWAWKRLSSSLNPRTLASGIKVMSSVLNPGKSPTRPRRT